MNAQEHIDYLAARRDLAAAGSLLASLYCSEGVEATDHAIGQGLRAWAVEREHGSRVVSAIVFGRSPSDALRRAAAPARLGEEVYGDITSVSLITSLWTEPVRWPFPSRDCAA